MIHCNHLKYFIVAGCSVTPTVRKKVVNTHLISNMLPFIMDFILNGSEPKWNDIVIYKRNGFEYA